jgi:hypothetical protein
LSRPPRLVAARQHRCVSRGFENSEAIDQRLGTSTFSGSRPALDFGDEVSSPLFDFPYGFFSAMVAHHGRREHAHRLGGPRGGLCVALAKTAAAIVTSSPAMAAEASHSLADTANDLFLLVAQRRSSRRRDDHRPFGHGRAAYFWALIAALGVFVAGAAFSLRRESAS